MQIFPNIERRDSGPAFRDATADPEVSYEAAYLDAVAHYTHLFDAGELCELVDEKLATLVKVGDALAVGQYLVHCFTRRINDAAQRRAQQ